MAAGEVLLLRGPNGAGKTTLLRLLAGLCPLDGGQGTVLGCDLSGDRKALRSQVGLLGHDLMLYDDLTVAENLRFFARLSGAGESEAAAALERLEVAPRLAEVTLRRLSAGQRKRVGLAALAVRRPRLWLLDEPHAGLDHAGRAAVNGLMAEAADRGATVLLAGHEVSAAADVTSRAVTLIGGMIVAPSVVQNPQAPEVGRA